LVWLLPTCSVAQPAELPPLREETPAVLAPVDVPEPRPSLAPHGSPLPTPVQQVVYKPLGGIAIFPVLRHGDTKAFGDLASLFATELAAQLEANLPGTRVLTPRAALTTLQQRGLGGIYRRMIESYYEGGRPDRQDLANVLRELSLGRKPIDRVIFVEAEVDYSRPTQSGRWLDRFRALAIDSPPKNATYHVESRIQVFDVGAPGLDRLWDFRGHDTLNADRIQQINPSVFTNASNQMVFGDTVRRMSRQALYEAPSQIAYETQLVETTRTDVQGRLLGVPSGWFHTQPAPSQGNASVTPQDRGLLQRILNRSASGSNP
jgi:hypothetical protein